MLSKEKNHTTRPERRGSIGVKKMSEYELGVISGAFITLGGGCLFAFLLNWGRNREDPF